MPGTPISAIGSVASISTGKYKGTVHYNSMEDLSGKKYRLECSMSPGGTVEIKFLQPPDPSIKIIFHGEDTSNTSANQPQVQLAPPTQFLGLLNFN